VWNFLIIWWWNYFTKIIKCYS